MGEILKKLRILNQKSQKEVADQIKISAPAYFKYENGDAKPTIENLKKLADFYNVSIDYLVGRSFSGDVGYLTDKQRSALELLKLLNERNLEKVVSFASGILAVQE